MNVTELDFGNEKIKYEVEAIQDSAVYEKELKYNQLPDFDYLVL